MQSASRSTPSSSRWSFRALPVAAAVLALASAAFGQSQAAVVTTTALTAAPASGASGKTTFTVHVEPAPQAAPGPDSSGPDSSDRGSVSLEETGSDGQPHSLGSAFVGADGNATLTVSALPAGSHDVRAVYSGNAASAASTSTPAEVTAEATAPDFSLTATPTTLNLDAGVQGTVVVSIAPIAGFNNYVSLSCAGLPLFTTCNFLPSNVDVTRASLSTMTLNTTARSGNLSSLRRDAGFVYAFLLPGALGLAGLCFGRNRSLRTLAMLCVVGSLIGGVSSCAQRYNYLNHGPTNNLGTPNGQSIIRIYGTAVTGALSTSKCFQITLNVTSTNTTGSAGNNLTPCS
ncbi:MAG TPA: Ig-like domain-containing protein [Acidobacteriaceae bacterium]|nr:Ig-like domain-containing protein [Acidobacteriaceae bacterium]